MSKRTRRKKRIALAGNAARHADLNNDNVVPNISFPVVMLLDDVDDDHDVERFAGSAKLAQAVAPTEELGTLRVTERREWIKKLLQDLPDVPDAKNLVRQLIDDLEGEPEKSPDPPHLATFLFLLIPLRQREHLLGDLDEEFRTRLVPEYGPRWARLYFYWHVAIELTTALTKAVTGAVLGFAISRLTK